MLALAVSRPVKLRSGGGTGVKRGGTKIILASAKREPYSSSHSLKWGSGEFLPRKIFEIADARTCVLTHFKAPKLLNNCLTFMEKNIFLVSLGQKLRAIYFYSC